MDGQSITNNLDGQPININLKTFKDTFQKPSQIYRYLRERWNEHPLFLSRTLSYVSKHRSKDAFSRGKCNDIDAIAKRLHKNPIKNNGTIKSKIASSSSANKSSNPEARDSTCFFNWICNDPARTSQKTKSHGFYCPWCETDLRYLDSLMGHLKFCHSRFTFNLVEEDDQSMIEMTLNLSFDGSYCGFKYPGHDMRHDYKFTPPQPERRMPTTQIIFFRAKKGINPRILDINRNGLIAERDSYAYDGGEADVDVCSGRLYYHTSTCLPVKPNELDIDSEADMDPDWLRERTLLMIDEFTDVNEGEKEILKLWNLHIMKNYKYKSDSMMPQACFDFVELEGSKILSRKLYRNFTLHLANLYDYGLISSGDLLYCIRKLNEQRGRIISPNKLSGFGTNKSERISNEHCQHSSPAKRALINSHCNK